MHFGISEGKGGLKHGSRPWLGMDIFWNCPIHRSEGKSAQAKSTIHLCGIYNVLILYISCGYTHLLPKLTLWEIASGFDQFGFPVRFIVLRLHCK